MSKPQRLCALIVALAFASALCPPARGEVRKDPNFGQPQIKAVTGSVKVFEGKVVDFGKVVHKGKIDINPTLKRIRAGKKLAHRNDGTNFFNKEGRLPRKKDRAYYREFVHPIKGVRLPGPCRVVIGKKGEVYFTGDHYKTFKRVR
jgi:hypothetical protein